MKLSKTLEIERKMNNKREKILISIKIDKDLLEKMNNFCQENKITRTNLIKNAIETYLQKVPLEKIIEELIFKYINSMSKNIEKRLIIEFDNMKKFLQEHNR